MTKSRFLYCALAVAIFPQLAYSESTVSSVTKIAIVRPVIAEPVIYKSIMRAGFIKLSEDVLITASATAALSDKNNLKDAAEIIDTTPPNVLDLFEDFILRMKYHFSRNGFEVIEVPAKQNTANGEVLWPESHPIIDGVSAYAIFSSGGAGYCKESIVSPYRPFFDVSMKIIDPNEGQKSLPAFEKSYYVGPSLCSSGYRGKGMIPLAGWFNTTHADFTLDGINKNPAFSTRGIIYAGQLAAKFLGDDIEEWKVLISK